jgi:hypothetical protein
VHRRAGRFEKRQHTARHHSATGARRDGVCRGERAGLGLILRSLVLITGWTIQLWLLLLLLARLGALRLLGGRRLGIVLSDHTDDDGATIFRHACKLGLEGIVSKRLSAPYRSGPSRDWIKVKNPDSPAMARYREGDW